MLRRFLTHPLQRLQSTMGQRLIVGVGLMACVLGGVGFYTIRNMNRLSHLTTQLYDHPFTVNTAVLRVEAGIISMHRSMKDVALANDVVEIEAAAKKVAEVEQTVFDNFDILLDRFLGEPAVIEEARQKFADWKIIRDRVIQLRQAGNVEAAAAITKGEGAQYIQALLSDIDAVETFAADKATEFLEDAHETRRQTLRWTTLLLLMASSLTLLWAVWMTRLLAIQEEHQTTLAQQTRRANDLLALPRMAENRDEVTFMQYGLELAENLTNSHISFIHLIHGNEETIELVNWSHPTLADYCSAQKNKYCPVKQAGIWADALRQRRPLVFNDYDSSSNEQELQQGLPSDKALLKRLISVPVIDKGKVVMLAGMGNKSTDYTDWDIETVQLISNYIWRIVKSNRTLSQLTKSEQRLREAQRVASIGSWELDLKTQILTWSDEVFRIFEIDPDSIQGNLTYSIFLAVIHPDDRERVNQAYLDAVDNHTTYDITHRLCMADGRIKHVREQCEIYYSADGSPEYSLGTVQDVTKEFLAAKKLRDAAAALKSTAEGVVITDLDGQIVDINHAFTKITGYSREEVIGGTPRLLKSDRHDSSFYHNMWSSLQIEGNWQGEIWNRNKTGNIYPELLTINVIQDDQGQATGYVGVFSDITAVKKSEQTLYKLAHHNSLTQLPNRRLLNLRLQQSIQQATEYQDSLALLFIDIDRFKQINDSLGHATGDILLQQVAQRLRQSLRSTDLVAHLNGDEFVILLENIQAQEGIVVILQKVMKSLASPFCVENHITSDTQEIYLTCSIGVSLFPQQGIDAATLLRNADTAMYHAKARGRNTYSFYTEEMTTAAFAHIQMENALRMALQRQELYLVYQPQFDFATNVWSGMEALLRWQHPTLGLVSPGIFVPIAEQTGLIREIGRWVLLQACLQGKAWLEQGLCFGPIAVNIAGPQLQSGDLVPTVQEALSKSGFPPHLLELEVTEGFVMQQPQERIQELEFLQQMGIQIAIDDFGTGYSSLSYLKQLPINKLKIDQTFVRNIPQDPNDMAIAEAVIALGKAMGLRIIAEGVETEMQADLMRAKGCHEAQGYFYSHPITAAAIETLLHQGVQVKA